MASGVALQKSRFIRPSPERPSIYSPYSPYRSVTVHSSMWGGFQGVLPGGIRKTLRELVHVLLCVACALPRPPTNILMQESTSAAAGVSWHRHRQYGLCAGHAGQWITEANHSGSLYFLGKELIVSFFPRSTSQLSRPNAKPIAGSNTVPHTREQLSCFFLSGLEKWSRWEVVDEHGGLHQVSMSNKLNLYTLGPLPEVIVLL